jgi:predicted RNA-binding protein YlqC (UPF0109 family)
MKEFIEYILNQIVSQPDKVSVSETEENGFVTYVVEVADEDMGLVIGKQGKTIKSIRSIVKAKAIKDGIRVRIELVDKNPPQKAVAEPTDAEVDAVIEAAEAETAEPEKPVDEA